MDIGYNTNVVPIVMYGNPKYAVQQIPKEAAISPNNRALNKKTHPNAREAHDEARRSPVAGAEGNGETSLRDGEMVRRSILLPPPRQ